MLSTERDLGKDNFISRDKTLLHVFANDAPHHENFIKSSLFVCCFKMKALTARNINKVVELREHFVFLVGRENSLEMKLKEFIIELNFFSESRRFF